MICKICGESFNPTWEELKCTFLARFEHQHYCPNEFKIKETEEERERQKILIEQEKCPHEKLIQVNSIAFEYGLGIVCSSCGKEMKEEEKKLYKELFPEEFTEKDKPNLNELQHKWELTDKKEKGE